MREISHKKNQVNINLVRPAVIAVKVKNFNHVLKTVHLEPIRLIVQEIILKIWLACNTPRTKLNKEGEDYKRDILKYDISNCFIKLDFFLFRTTK